MTSATMVWKNDFERAMHKNKLLLANAMADLLTGFGGRPAPRMTSYVYYGNSLTAAIERAIIDTRADTVVMGSRGLGQKTGIGSTTDWAARSVRSNVIIVPPATLDHRGHRHMAVHEKPYQREKAHHKVFGPGDY